MAEKIFNPNNPADFYKYLPAKRAVDFFNDCSLRFTPNGSLNDPFEYAQVDRDYLSNLSEDEKLALFANCSNDFRHSPSLVAGVLSNKVERLKKTSNSTLIASPKKGGGVLCFSETPSNLLMWSHYASEHQGMVIEINSSYFFDKNLYENLGKFIIHRTRYRDSRIEDQQEGLYELLFRTPIETSATKSSHWSYEQEWRIEATFNSEEFRLATDSAGKHKYDHCGEPIFLHNIPKKYITKVIFGANCCIKNIVAIKNKLASDPSLSHITMKLAVMDPIEYKIRIINLKQEDFSQINENEYAA